MTSHRISWYAQPDVFYHSEDSLRALQQLEGRLESETKRCSRLEAAVEDARVQLSKHNNELSRAEELSTDLHHFLQMCERGQGRRPRAVELLRTSFVRRAAPHEDVVKLLEDVRRLENGN